MTKSEYRSTPRGLEHAPRAAAIATVLGVVRPRARVWPVLPRRARLPPRPIRMLQTLMYLKLSVAGHLTILTRTRGPWWSTRPANILLLAVLGTQTLATLMAIFGFGIMTPLGWQLAAFVWGYAIVCALLTDPVKLLAYRILDPTPAKDPSSAAKPPGRKLKVAAAT